MLLLYGHLIQIILTLISLIPLAYIGDLQIHLLQKSFANNKF